MNVELTTKQKGNLTELQCLTYFYKLGYRCSIPYGENCRYDFILDINNNLYKIQVKTSSPIDEEESAIQFSCRSTRVNTSGTNHQKYTAQEINFFATYYKDKCYLIPQNECSNAKILRFIPPRSGRLKNINFARDYEAEVIIQKYLNKEEVE